MARTALNRLSIWLRLRFPRFSLGNRDSLELGRGSMGAFKALVRASTVPYVCAEPRRCSILVAEQTKASGRVLR